MTDQEALDNKIRAQDEGLQAWVVNEYKGTFEWATGVGKSRGSILVIEYIRTMLKLELPGLLVVPTEEMRDVDWPAEFTKWNCPMDNLKVVCYASLSQQDLSKYSFIIYDECHRLTLTNLQKLYYFKGPLLGLTATFPKIKNEDEEERVKMFEYLLPPVHTITTDEAVDLGLIADFEVMVLKYPLDAVNKNIRSGSKKRIFLRTETEEYKYLTRQLQMCSYVPDKEKLKFIYISKRMQLLTNLPSKLRLAKHCMKRLLEEPDKRTLVLCGNIDQANELCGDNVFHSKSNSEALDKFQRKEINLLGAVKALNEGKNLVDLDQLLIVVMDGQERNLVQRIGRAVRKRTGKPDFKARIIILIALSTAEEKWYATAIKGFESSRIREYLVKVPDVNTESPAPSK